VISESYFRSFPNDLQTVLQSLCVSRLLLHESAIYDSVRVPFARGALAVFRVNNGLDGAGSFASSSPKFVILPVVEAEGIADTQTRPTHQLDNCSHLSAELKRHSIDSMN
jgi:hypothetical protein